MPALPIALLLLLLPRLASADQPAEKAQSAAQRARVAQPPSKKASPSDAPALDPAPTAFTALPEPEPAQPPVPSPPQEAPRALEPPAATAETPRSGDGPFNPSALLQAWFIAEHGPKQSTGVRIRRAELSLQGDVVPARVAYRVSVDLAKVLEPSEVRVPIDGQEPAPVASEAGESVSVQQPSSPLSIVNDVYITYLTPYADVSLGQFKIPVSLEGLLASSKTLFAQRAPVSREFGDRRDLGLRASKDFGAFTYTAALLNGSGANTWDRDSAKDGAVRLELRALPGLTLAGALYATLWHRNRPGAKDRLEVAARYEIGPWLLQAEYIRARDFGRVGSVHAQGFYIAARYLVLKVLEPVLRIGALDRDLESDVGPNLGPERSEFWHVDLGVNYTLAPDSLKLTLDYSRFQYDDLRAGNEWIFAAQLVF